MKKLIISLLALLSITVEGNAQVSGLSLGYCDGQSTTKGSITSSEKNVWVSAAIYIPAGTINTYSGNHIDSINVALASKLNVDTLKVWLRSSLDGENLAEGTITSASTQKISKEWNKVGLDTPYNVERTDNGLYIGYSFHQKGASFGIAALTSACKNALFVQLPGEEWTDRSSEGTLCVEGLVYGDNLPKLNVALQSVDAQSVYVIDKGTMKITGSVKNLATQTVTGFDVLASIDGSEETCTAHVDASLAYKQTMDFSVTVNPTITATGKGKVTVTIANLAEGDDEDPSDNVLTDTFSIVQTDYTRNIIIEEFTTEQCSNCPRMASYLHSALEKDAYKERAFAACHHSGYYTDWLTSTCDNSYLWFFNAGGATYAPAIMIDRINLGESTPVICPSSQTELELYMDYALSQPAFVSVNVSAVTDTDNPQLVHVKVNGTKSVETLCANPRLVVYALEDNVDARSQAGATSFVHNHVKRAFNSTWGDALEWNGDTYEYACDFEISSECVKENMQVVAFIYNYNSEDATDCAVANSGSTLIEDAANYITPVTANNSGEVEYFSLSGRKVSAENLTKGIFIVKKGGKATKVVIGK